MPKCMSIAQTSPLNSRLLYLPVYLAFSLGFRIDVRTDFPFKSAHPIVFPLSGNGSSSIQFLKLKTLKSSLTLLFLWHLFSGRFCWFHLQYLHVSCISPLLASTAITQKLPSSLLDYCSNPPHCFLTSTVCSQCSF